MPKLKFLYQLKNGDSFYSSSGLKYKVIQSGKSNVSVRSSMSGLVFTYIGTTIVQTRSFF